MAIYTLQVKNISRKQGRSSVGAAAYRAGEKLENERDGVTHDYTKKGHIAHKEVMTPEGTPEWAKDRKQLWNEVEKSEKRINSRTAKEIVIALPKEFNLEQQKELVREFTQKNFVDKGMIADVCIHDKKDGNPHAHLMLTTREIDKDGFSKKKNRDWHQRKNVKEWRKEWEVTQNKHLEKEGIEKRVDCRSWKDKGIDHVPLKHLGYQASSMEKRGIQTEKGNFNREAAERNKQLEVIEKEAAKVVEAFKGKVNEIQQDVERGKNAILEKYSKELENVATKVMDKIDQATMTPQEREALAEQKLQSKISHELQEKYNRQAQQEKEDQEKEKTDREERQQPEKKVDKRLEELREGRERWPEDDKKKEQQLSKQPEQEHTYRITVKELQSTCGKQLDTFRKDQEILSKREQELKEQKLTPDKAKNIVATEYLKKQGYDVKSIMQEKREIEKERQQLAKDKKQHEQNKPGMLDFKAKAKWNEQRQQLEQKEKELMEREQKRKQQEDKARQELQKPEVKQSLDKRSQEIQNQHNTKLDKELQQVSKQRWEIAEQQKEVLGVKLPLEKIKDKNQTIEIKGDSKEKVLFPSNIVKNADKLIDQANEIKKQERKIEKEIGRER